MKALLISAVLAVAALSPAGLSAAESQSVKTECYERSNLLYSLATEFGERLEQTRRIGASGLLESFKSNSGTWTIVYSNDEGLSCVLGMGSGLKAEDGEKQTAEFGV